MTWFDYVIVGVIICVGLIIMYRALKEPLDLLFGGIWHMMIWGKESITGGVSEPTQIIRYG